MDIIRRFRASSMRTLAFGLTGLLFALMPVQAFAGRPEIDCSTLSEEDSMNFYNLSGLSADAAANKNYDEALNMALKAMSICTSDVYTEYTLARIYHLTGDCANAYYHYEILSEKPASIQKENPDIYKELKKNFKDVKNKCGNVVTLEIECEQPGIQLAISGLGDVSTTTCPFYAKVLPGSYPVIATKEDYQARKETINVEAGKGTIVKIPELKEADSKGFLRVRCPKGATKFELKNSEGHIEEYVCPWEQEFPADTYTIKLSGAPDEDAVTVVVDKKSRLEHVIPTPEPKSKCSANPLENSSAPLSAALLGLLGMFGFATLRRRAR